MYWERERSGNGTGGGLWKLACLSWILKFAQLQPGCFTNPVFTATNRDNDAKRSLVQQGCGVGAAGAAGPTEPARMQPQSQPWARGC